MKTFGPIIAFSFFGLSLLSSTQAGIKKNDPTSLPISFRKNIGQWDNNIAYKGRSGTASVSYLKNGLSYAFVKDAGIQAEDGSEQQSVLVYNAYFLNSNKNCSIEGANPQNSRNNYINERGTFNDVPDHDEILYKEIYKDVDIRYYNYQGLLKYDVLVNPLGDVSQVIFKMDGIEALDISRTGDLEVSTAWGTLIEAAPYSYQIIDGIKKEVDVRYNIVGENTFGFKVFGSYDRTKQLVIDPIVLRWSTFIAATTVQSTGYVRDIELDAAHNIFGAGFYSVNFPTTPGVYNPTRTYNVKSNMPDMTAFKLSPDGSQLLWATYIGGTDSDMGRGISLDKNGNVVVIGTSTSTNFPTTVGAYQATFGGGTADITLFKLSADGRQLLYSTYLGGANNEGIDYEFGAGLEVTSDDDVIAAVSTSSNNFPVTSGTYDQTKNGGVDVAAFRFDMNQNKMEWSTYIGGGEDDVPAGFTIDKNENVYVVGRTGDNTNYGTPFPTTIGAYQTDNAGYMDGFVVKINKDGASLAYSTFIGSTLGWDMCNSIKVLDNGQVWVVGNAKGKDFPTTSNAYRRYSQVGPSDISDVVFFRLSADGSQLLYSSFIGGKAYDTGRDITVASNGDVYIVGTTASDNWPAVTACAYDPTYDQMEDGFMARFDPTGRSLIYGTIYGGESNDYKERIQLVESSCGVEKVIISLSAHSPDFPVTPGSFQDLRSTGMSDTPTIMSFEADVPVDFSFTPGTCGSPVPFNSQSSSTCVWSFGPWTPSSWTWDFGDGTTSTEQNPTHTFGSSGSYEVTLRVGCPSAEVTKTVTITGTGSTVELGPDVTTCGTINETLSAGTQPTGTTYNWSTGANTNSIHVTAPGTYWVEVSNGGCPATDTIVLSQASKLNPWVNGVVNPACNGTQGEAKANPGDGGGQGPYTYLWSDGQTTRTALHLNAGTHAVTVTNKYGCTGTTNVDISGSVGFELSSSIVYDDGCDRFGGTVGEATAAPDGGTAPYNYEWTDSQGQTTQTATGLAAGSYEVTVTDSKGCTKTETVNIEQKIQVNITIDSQPCGGCTNGQLTGTVAGFGAAPFTYRWNDANEQTDLSATNLPAGTYVLLVTDANGCFNSDTVSIGITSIHQSSNIEQQLSVYPNPSKGQFTIQTEEGQSGTYRIYDARGRVVISDQLSVGGTVMEERLNNGVYLLEIEIEGRRMTKRLLISN